MVWRAGTVIDNETLNVTAWTVLDTESQEE